MDRRIFLYLIPIILLLSLMYVVVHFFFPPKIGMENEIGAETGQECSAGETRACVSEEGCRGYRPCQLGRFGECVIDYECTPGEMGDCPFTVCAVGKRTCDGCGRWGVCIGPPGCEGTENCSASSDTN